MNYITIENKLHDIQQRAWHYGDLSKARLATAPLEWYVLTDRAPLEFTRSLCNTNGRQVTTIAKRLLKHAGGDYWDAIDSIRKYLLNK